MSFEDVKYATQFLEVWNIEVLEREILCYRRRLTIHGDTNIFQAQAMCWENVTRATKKEGIIDSAIYQFTGDVYSRVSLSNSVFITDKMNQISRLVINYEQYCPGKIITWKKSQKSAETALVLTVT